ncbi:SDR family oxidoreductase [Limosilactobacillus sp. STM2_1]|uniref:SDR family oxidoreductase n=1 Tax=Limosilactobacillus rudii TaxID=2759755 RepID=A0A7W3UKC4_9LACO|nr:SDR family oxidoreductase [Limosilactobacillus rudii]MBB1078465.1 SDR family oxidoreductase [Limosilactobacillus rudii]MBB1096595.1 SDR family oxidoreductase [Limosilactobacillus rudii]MCD7134209.1 SDR family oxidoreductase [Limosilactobacillus rudii]
MKTVVITGAATGMGLRMSELFYQKGWNIVMAGRNKDKGEREASKIRQKDVKNKIIFISTDVTDAFSIQNLVKETYHHFDHADAIINNAGIFVQGRVDKLSENVWNKVIAVDLNAVFLMTKYFVPKMMERKNGSILNIASVSGLLGDYSSAPYNAAKGAVVNLVRSMALDYGKYGIRVNNICPGATETAMFKQNPISVQQEYRKTSPLGYIARPIDIAQAAYFLSNDETAHAITGINLPVTAGFGIFSGQPRQ